MTRLIYCYQQKKPGVSEAPTVDYPWQITKEYRDAEGYVNSKKVEVGFFDSDSDGVVDNPDLFPDFVAPDVDVNTKFVSPKRNYYK